MAAGDDPRQPEGAFGDLFAAIRRCKEACTCPALRIRSYYFEPNPATAHEWHEAGLFQGPIDRRVVFVCESPGPSGTASNQPDVAQPRRCWTQSPRDRRFAAVRRQYGLHHCYITNTVKCGPRADRRHTAAELAACLPFLVRELELIRPPIVVAVGQNAWQTLTAAVLGQLTFRPRPLQITHYAFRGDPWPRWDAEFAQLLALLEPKALP